MKGWFVLEPVKESLKPCNCLLPVTVVSVLKQWLEMALVHFYCGECC